MKAKVELLNVRKTGTLTDQHASSSGAQLVLVVDGIEYGPGDLVGGRTAYVVERGAAAEEMEKLQESRNRPDEMQENDGREEEKLKKKAAGLARRWNGRVQAAIKAELRLIADTADAHWEFVLRRCESLLQDALATPGYLALKERKKKTDAAIAEADLDVHLRFHPECRNDAIDADMNAWISWAEQALEPSFVSEFMEGYRKSVGTNRTARTRLANAEARKPAEAAEEKRVTEELLALLAARPGQWLLTKDLVDAWKHQHGGTLTYAGAERLLRASEDVEEYDEPFDRYAVSRWRLARK
jgi:hypothetical protein